MAPRCHKRSALAAVGCLCCSGREVSAAALTRSPFAPRVLHKIDGGWRWLPSTSKEAPAGTAIVTVVHCPTDQALKWALPWGARAGPLSIEEVEEQNAFQLQQHRKLEAELGTEVQGYASYVLGEVQKQSDYLVLIELPDLVSSKVWEGALMLRELALARRNWPGSSVLELGAGVGLVGLALASVGADVVLTDMGDAMPILNTNTRENKDVVQRCGGQARAVELDWLWSETRQRAAMPLPKVDIVLGADIVYTLEASLAMLQTALRFGSELWLLQNIHRAASSEFLTAAVDLGLSVRRETVRDNYELWQFQQKSSSLHSSRIAADL